MMHIDRAKEELNTLRLYFTVLFATAGSLIGWLAAKHDRVENALVVLAVAITVFVGAGLFMVTMRIHRLQRKLERYIWSGP